MGQKAQTDFAILAVIASGPQSRSEVSLEHAEDGFNLPTLTICLPGKSSLHQLTVPPSHRKRAAVPSRPTALRRRDDTANAVSFPTESMEAFRFVPGIPQKAPEPLMVQGFTERLIRFDRIDLGTTIDHRSEDEMVGGIADRRQFRIAMFVVVFMLVTASGVIGRDVTGFQTGRIYRSLFGASPQYLRVAAVRQDGVEKRIGLAFAQQSLRRRTQRREVRHPCQAEEVP